MSSKAPPTTRERPVDDTKLPYSTGQNSEASLARYGDDSSSEPVRAFLEDPAFAGYYVPIEKYEGKHRYDPKATWTETEEKQLVRKVCLMFFALQLDRSNITQALSDNMLGDLGINTNDYNLGQTIFYVCFLFAELPSQLISKKIGPDNWIPIQMVLWSVIACSQSHLNGRGSFFATRALLGIMEGGFIPDVILYLSYFYTTKELPVRLSYFWTSYQFTSIVSAFLAFGILRLRGVNGWSGWRWLYALEGGLTALIGIISWFYMPPSPTQTKGGLRGKDGWFSEREEVIMVNRVLRDDPSKGDMHNRQAVTPKLLWQSLSDYDMWPIYLIGLTWNIPNTPMQSYLTLTLKSLGYDTFTTNLLTIPASVLFIIQLLFWTWVSERVNERLLFGVLTQLWMLGPLVALAVLPDSTSPWVFFTMATMLIGFIYVHAILVALTSRNAGSVRTRTVGSALYNMTVQTSNIISSNIYRDDDKPRYRRGNRVLLAILAYNCVLFIGAKLYYIWRNKSRDRIWNAMTQQEKENYLATTTDKGNKRLDFRFSH